MIKEFLEFLRYHELLYRLVWRDIKLRYKNSFLGFLWSFINPALQVIVIWFVFKYIVLHIHVKNYSAWVLSAFLPWTFFQMSLMDASQSILLHFAVLKKVYFPREILPLSTVISNLVHFLLSLVIFFLYASLVKIRFTPALLLLPLVILLHLFLTSGLALVISALNVYYEDIKYLTSVLLSLLFYLTPVLYPSNFVPDEWFTLYRLNPMAHLVILYQKVLLAGAEPIDPRPLDPLLLGITVLTCLLVGLFGYAFFNRRKWEFAELL